MSRRTPRQRSGCVALSFFGEEEEEGLERERRRAILQAQAQSYVLKRLLWHRPRDFVAGATGQGDVDETESNLRPLQRVPLLPCYTGSKLSESVKLKGNTFDAALSSCTSSKLCEIVYSNVDSETGSLELMGSGLDSIFCLRLSPVGVTTYTESGGPPSTAPACHTCSKLSETVNLKVNIFASKTGNFDLTDCDLESISCLGKSLANATSPTGRKDPLPFLLSSAAPSCCMSSQLSETANVQWSDTQIWLASS